MTNDNLKILYFEAVWLACGLCYTLYSHVHNYLKNYYIFEFIILLLL